MKPSKVNLFDEWKPQLIGLAKHLQKQRMLDFQPSFLFPVISALGYMNGDAHKLVKFMSMVFNKTMDSHKDD